MSKKYVLLKFIVSNRQQYLLFKTFAMQIFFFYMYGTAVSLLIGMRSTTHILVIKMIYIYSMLHLFISKYL